MFSASINPHRLCLTGPREAAFLEELDSSPVGDQDVHVESLVPASQLAEDFRADPTTPEVRVYQQVRVVNDQVPVRERIAQPDKPILSPGSDH
jgi:hypothetical protein